MGKYTRVCTFAQSHILSHWKAHLSGGLLGSAGVGRGHTRDVPLGSLAQGFEEAKGLFLGLLRSFALHCMSAWVGCVTGAGSAGMYVHALMEVLLHVQAPVSRAFA